MSKKIILKEIDNYGDFTSNLLLAGMSMGGDNSEGVFSLSSRFTPSIHWHNEDPETDPWEWRMRVLDERNDIAYTKLFFKKSGYISKEWYPYFYAVRRGNQTFEQACAEEKLSPFAQQIFSLVRDNGTLPLHIIKLLGNFSKEQKTKFDNAMVELQTKMYITMCGRAHKLSSGGEQYGWQSTVFCTVESFFDTEVFEKAAKLSRDEAYKKIEEQIYSLNSEALPKKVKKFIEG